MTAKLTQQEVNSAAWAACESFRGAADPAQCRDYVLAMLFLKYISDVWKERCEAYRKQHGDDEERIGRKLRRERFKLPMVEIQDFATGNLADRFVADFQSLFDRRTAIDIGELINTTLDRIEEVNKERLAGIFRHVDFNSERNLGKARERNRRLKNLLEAFQKLDLRPANVAGEVVGGAYSYLVERFATAAGKKSGEFHTPRPVSKLLAQLAEPRKTGRIYDPCCGSGGLLIEAAAAVQSTGTLDFALFGQEANGSTAAMARMNLLLHGRDDARVEWGDTLDSPALLDRENLMRFEVVVSNPPFSPDKWGAENAATDRYNRYWRGVPPKSKGDFAFICHMIESAVPRKGRVVVVVPHGVLFRTGVEARIRRTLIEENLLDAVIGLPPNLFSTTSIPVAILRFDRSRERGGAREGVRDVLFVDASAEFVASKHRNSLSDAHCQRILAAVRARTAVKQYAHVAWPEEIERNEFNLNIAGYLQSAATHEEIDVAALEREIGMLESELAEVRAGVRVQLGALGI